MIYLINFFCFSLIRRKKLIRETYEQSVTPGRFLIKIVLLN